MENKNELEELFKEIDRMSPPVFDMLPKVIYCDKDLTEIVDLRRNDLIKYVKYFSPSEKKTEYLKKFIHFKNKKEIIYFDYAQLREFFNNLIHKSYI